MLPSKIILILIISLLAYGISGCSSKSISPIVPSNPSLDNISLPDVYIDESLSNRHQLGIWNVEFDVDKLSADVIPVRSGEWHFSVRSYLPPPLIQNITWDPINEIIGADVTIQNENPYMVHAYDVRLIIYTDSAGHILDNSDSWTGLFDIPGGEDINPFKAYDTDDVINQRKLNYLEEKMRHVDIYCPNSNFFIQWGIDASYPDNCDEPFDLSSFDQEEILYDNLGSSARLSVNAYDWQNDIDSVAIECPQITGEPETYFTHESGYKWILDIVNNVPASEGEYDALFWTTSVGSGNLKLYDKVSISITEPPCDLVVDEIVGPYEMDDNTDESFSIAASGESNITYKWTCDPVGAGQFNPDDSTPTVFHANDVDTETVITIQVEVNAVSNPICEPVLKTLDITIHAPDQTAPDWDSSIGITDAISGVEQVTVHWGTATDADSPPVEYLLYMSENNPPWDQPREVVSNIYEYPFTGLVNGREYWFGVRCRDSANPPNEDSNIEVLSAIPRPLSPFNPVILKTVDTPEVAQSVDVSNGYAYVADRNSGMQIIDVDPISTAHIMNSVPMGSSWIYDVQIEGNYAYIANSSYDFAIADINPPSSASIIKEIEIPHRGTWCVHVVGDYAYAGSDSWRQFYIFDINPPSSAYLLKTVDITEGPYGIYISGDYAYVASDTAAEEGLLEIYDINPPGSTHKVGAIETPMAALGVCVENNYAYVCARESGLHIVDISTPESASIVHSVDTEFARSICIVDNYAFLADQSGGVKILDITTPASACIIDSIVIEKAWDVCISGNYAYVANWDYGLTIVDLYYEN